MANYFERRLLPKAKTFKKCFLNFHPHSTFYCHLI